MLAPEYTCGVFFQKNGSLGELEHQELIAFLLVDWVLQSRDCKEGGVAFGQDCGLKLCGECAQKCDKENQEWRWRQIKAIDGWHLNR